jgi:hypothetical protein
MKIFGRINTPGVKPHMAPQTITPAWRGAQIGGMMARPSAVPTTNSDPIGFSDQRRLLLPVRGAANGSMRSRDRL